MIYLDLLAARSGSFYFFFFLFYATVNTFVHLAPLIFS